MNPISVVITHYPRGYVAHIRYIDKREDMDISHVNLKYLYALIESCFK